MKEDRTIGDEWDYRIRRVEMAWELASGKITQLQQDRHDRSMPDKDFYAAVEAELKIAWNTSENALPTGSLSFKT